MNWDKLRIFHAVAEAGSFTHACDVLKLSQSAISRQISALETALRVPLFHRHARGLILTEQGEKLYRTAKDISSRLEMTQTLLLEGREKASGHLTITTTTAFGCCWLMPRLPDFMEKYRDISISLILDDNDLDLEMREADIAIRLHPSHQPNLIQRHLADIPLAIYASAAYLSRFGTPRTLADLAAHQIILFGGSVLPAPQINWLATALPEQPSTRRRPRLEINSLNGMAIAVNNGAGVASLPAYTAAGHDNIVRVLEDVAAPSITAFFVYPEELRNLKRIALFRDFVLQNLNVKQP